MGFEEIMEYLQTKINACKKSIAIQDNYSDSHEFYDGQLYALLNLQDGLVSLKTRAEKKTNKEKFQESVEKAKNQAWHSEMYLHSVRQAHLALDEVLKRAQEEYDAANREYRTLYGLMDDD